METQCGPRASEAPTPMIEETLKMPPAQIETGAERCRRETSTLNISLREKSTC